MVEFLILFFSTLILAVFFAWQGVIINKSVTNNRIFKWNIFYCLSYFICVLFLGTRVDIGIDFPAYRAQYIQGYEFELGVSKEYGMVLLVDILKYLGFEFQWFIVITSIILVLLIFNCFKNANYLLPYAIFFFFLGSNFQMSINIIRQAIAIMAFLNIIMYKVECNDAHFSCLCKIVFYLILGFLFHYSIVLIIPILFIPKSIYKKLTGVRLFVLLLVVAVLMKVSVDYLMGWTISLFPKYSYTYGFIEEKISEKESISYFVILHFIVRCTPLLFYNVIKRRNPDISIYYFLYTLGVAIIYTFYGISTIERFGSYFLATDMIVYSYMCYHLLRNSRKRYIFNYLYAVVFIVIMVFSFVLKTPGLMQRHIPGGFSIYGLDVYR